jgi:hypothetical protein
MSDHKKGICKMRSDPLSTFDLHNCKLPGRWVGVTDSVYADEINQNWIEGYHMSFTALETGKLQVVVKEGLCGHERCEAEYEGRLSEVLNDE